MRLEASTTNTRDDATIAELSVSLSSEIRKYFLVGPADPLSLPVIKN